MPLIPYLGGICKFSSTLTFAIVMRPSYSFAISSRTGARVLHGPHHSAQKSTKNRLCRTNYISIKRSVTDYFNFVVHVLKKKEINNRIRIILDRIISLISKKSIFFTKIV